MQNLLTIIWINSPLLIGYLFNLSVESKWYHLTDYLLTVTLYTILFVTGVSITSIDNLGSEIFKIFYYAGLILALTLILNILVMKLYDLKVKPKVLKNRTQNYSSRWKIIVNSFKQIVWVIFGGLFGFVFPKWLPHADVLANALLMLMLFIIGLQLRSSGVHLKEVLLNRKGMQLSVLFIISCWIAAILVAYILSLPIRESLAINSGFGWYSMSGSLVTKVYGAFLGGLWL
ncbi:MAG: LysO family transporter [Neisseriaceae bacterium]|nr:LysO family transporter [Neisseriaceae bacterium]